MKLTNDSRWPCSRETNITLDPFTSLTHSNTTRNLETIIYFVIIERTEQRFLIRVRFILVPYQINECPRWQMLSHSLGCEYVCYYSQTCQTETKPAETEGYQPIPMFSENLLIGKHLFQDGQCLKKLPFQGTLLKSTKTHSLFSS